MGHDKLQTFDVPLKMLRFPRERIEPLVKHYGKLAQFGTLDLTTLAVSAYLQGVLDGVQVAAMRPEVRALYEDESSTVKNTDNNLTKTDNQEQCATTAGNPS